jgi:enamine deaminase RidA (YjgF/YER057c/UK114 family)
MAPKTWNGRADASRHRPATGEKRDQFGVGCHNSPLSVDGARRNRLTLAPRRPKARRMSIDTRLAELGIILPEPAAPVAAYVAAVEANGLLHVSGQLPFRDGQLMTGRCGEDQDEDYAQQAAERCGVMLLAQIRKALGSLDRVERVVKLGVFVSSAPHFTAQPKVANGASELMQRVFGDAGRHARSAVGVPVLPLNAVVEVDAVVAIKA